MHKNKLILAILISVLLAGCNGNSAELAQHEQEQILLMNEVEALKQEQALLIREIESFKSINIELEEEVAKLEGSNKEYNSIIEVLENSTADPIFRMKLATNIGMEMDYLVESISDGVVYYQSFDYQHSDSPEETLQSMTIHELFGVEAFGNENIQKYILVLYLDYGEFTLNLAPNQGFNKMFNNDMDYRTKIADALNKPANKNLAMQINHLIQ